MDPDLLDRALGPRLNWTPVPRPDGATLAGRSVSLQHLDTAAHADALYRASHGEDSDPLLWLYMGSGPFNTLEEYRTSVERNSISTDPLFYAIIPAGKNAAGQASYLRIDPDNGVIEIGHIWFGSSLQRSRAATEAIYLLAKHAFDELGYRRLEWKCNARNDRSRRAAKRLGFTYEGTFRNAVVVRDRNRDTAWFSITKEEWAPIRTAFETWLSDDNFDADGRQRRSLSVTPEVP
jgi:RimJ/RimL family protein N-acetyltransferase